MKVYIKNGIVVGTNIYSISVNNNTILNPTDEFLIENGYEIKNLEDTNSDIELKRAEAYANETDVLFNRYLIYKELGDIEKSEKAKQEWIELREKIKDNNPYIGTNSYEDWSSVMEEVTVDRSNLRIFKKHNNNNE